MTTTNFNDFIKTLLTGTYATYGSQPPIVRLYKDSREGTIQGYLELDPDECEPIQSHAGNILFTWLKGNIKINATVETNRGKIYDDIVTLLKATVYAFELGSFKDEDKEDLYERDFSLKILYPG